MSDITFGRRLAVTPGRAPADSRLSMSDRHLLQILCLTDSVDSLQRRGGWFSLPQAFLAKLSGLSRGTVSASVKTLQACGYLAVREQTTLYGGKTSHLYKILFDEELPAEFDRWADLLDDAAAAVVLPQTSENDQQPLELLDVGNSDRGMSENRTGGMSENRTGVHNPADSVMSDNQTGGMSESQTSPNLDVGNSDISIEDSDSITTSITKDLRFDSIRFDSKNEIVDLFLALRAQWFGNRGGTVGKRDSLARQAEQLISEVMAEGFPEADAVSLISTVLAERIAQNSEAGLEPPTALARYRADIQGRVAAIRRTEEAGKRRDAAVQAAQAAQSPVDNPVWSRVKTRVRSTDSTQAREVAVWLDLLILKHVDEDGTVHFAAQSSTAKSVVEGHGEVLRAALAAERIGTRIDIAVGGQ